MLFCELDVSNAETLKCVGVPAIVEFPNREIHGTFDADHFCGAREPMLMFGRPDANLVEAVRAVRMIVFADAYAASCS